VTATIYYGAQMAERTNSNMLFANFNQDFSYVERSIYSFNSQMSPDNRCISVGTRKGYSITNCDPFGRVYTMSQPYHSLSVESMADN